MKTSKNVMGGPLKECCRRPMTGFFRNGRCETCPEDRGRHVICAEVTAPFLEFTRQRGNDLSTPQPRYAFPGLQPGDRWCLCAGRWKEALGAGVAPPVILAACHEDSLQSVSLSDLQKHATS